MLQLMCTQQAGLSENDFSFFVMEIKKSPYSLSHLCSKE